MPAKQKNIYNLEKQGNLLKYPRRSYIAIILIFCGLAPLMAQDNIQGSPHRIFTFYSEELKRSADKDYNRALMYMDSALAIAPHYSKIRYARARIMELGGNTALAQNELQILIDQKQQIVSRI